MKITKIEKNNKVCAIVNSPEKVITNVQSALDLLMTIKCLHRSVIHTWYA